MLKVVVLQPCRITKNEFPNHFYEKTDALVFLDFPWDRTGPVLWGCPHNNLLHAQHGLFNVGVANPWPIEFEAHQDHVDKYDNSSNNIQNLLSSIDKLGW